MATNLQLTPTHMQWLTMLRNVQAQIEAGWLDDARQILNRNKGNYGIGDEAREMFTDLNNEVERQYRDASPVIDHKPIRVALLAAIGAITEEAAK